MKIYISPACCKLQVCTLLTLKQTATMPVQLPAMTMLDILNSRQH